jgi:hypothetical protein
MVATEEPFRTFPLIAAETGLRAGELCGLRLEDVDLEANQLHEAKCMAWKTSGTENAERRADTCALA